MPDQPQAPTTLAQNLRRAIAARRGVLTSLAVLAGLWGASLIAWRVYGPEVARRPQYRATAQTIRVTDPPAWVRGDVVAEALANSEHADGFSTLAPPAELREAVFAALGGHPWVRRVLSVQTQPPNRVLAEVEYRRPVAALKTREGLIPIDLDATPLPPGSLPRNLVQRLPRVGLAIGEAESRCAPLPQSPWPSQELAGAVALVAAFGDAWRDLHLFEVHVEQPPIVRDGGRYYGYRLRSTGNTIIFWGAAPGVGPQGETPFNRKLALLRELIARSRPLDSVVTSPEWIDVRNGIEAHRRVVLRDGSRLAAQPDDDTPVTK